jgi:hypothetical protein
LRVARCATLENENERLQQALETANAKALERLRAAAQTVIHLESTIAELSKKAAAIAKSTKSNKKVSTLSTTTTMLIQLSH